MSQRFLIVASLWASESHLDLWVQAFLDVAQVIMQAKATFPAWRHYESVRLATHVDTSAPPETTRRPQRERLSQLDLALGDVVELRVPTGLLAAVAESVPAWEADGVTPHRLVARVTELFVDAKVRTRICSTLCPPC